MPSSQPEASRTRIHGAIAGIGIDLVEIDRFRATDDLPAILRQILTDNELTQRRGIQDDPALCATLFAIKEAILKALGSGPDLGSCWHEVEITADFHAVLSGRVQRHAAELEVKSVLIAPCCTGSAAMALAIART